MAKVTTWQPSNVLCSDLPRAQRISEDSHLQGPRRLQIVVGILHRTWVQAHALWQIEGRGGGPGDRKSRSARQQKLYDTHRRLENGTARAPSAVSFEYADTQA